MSLFLDSENNIYNCEGGSDIRAVIDFAIFRAKKEKLVSFKFNQIIVHVTEDSSSELVFRDWNRALRGKINKTIGPCYIQTLSEVAIAHDKKIDDENQKRIQDFKTQHKGLTEYCTCGGPTKNILLLISSISVCTICGRNKQ